MAKTKESAEYYTGDPVQEGGYMGYPQNVNADAVEEAQAPPHPVNWKNGFQKPYRIGGGGSETPFLQGNRWVLRVFNTQDKKHYLYDYGTDMMSIDEQNAITEAQGLGGEELQAIANRLIPPANRLIRLAYELQYTADVERDRARGRLYPWAGKKNFSDKETVDTLMSNIDNQLLSLKDRNKYIAIDRGGSGRFLVDKTDGEIYGIKAYGVIHRGYKYGNIMTTSPKALVMASGQPLLHPRYIEQAAQGVTAKPSDVKPDAPGTVTGHAPNVVQFPSSRWKA